jgi:hypothetical protein
MDIPIRLDDDGTLLIGTPPAAPAGAGHVLLRGAEVFLDPTAPDDPPYVVVHHLDDAATALELLHGAEVAAAAGRVADGAPEESPTVEPGLAAAAIRELTVVRWLETHSPDLLPAGLLDLGFGTAAAGLDDLLAQVEEEDATRRLVHRAGLVVDLARRLRDGDTPAPAGLAALVDAALPAVSAVLPFDSPHLDDLTHEEQLARALRALGDGTRLNWSQLASLPGIGDRTVEAATSGGFRSVTVEERLASVDWHQVPRGLLDTAEETVTWSVSPGAPPLVTVSVRAVAGAPPFDGLAFRLYGSGVPLPIAVGRLSLAPGGDAFTGTAPLVGAATDPMTLDVHDTRGGNRPRLGMDRTTAQGVRWAARAVTALRLGGPSGDADRAARAAVQQAARLFRQVGARHPDSHQQELARRRRVRSFALLRAVLLRGPRSDRPEAEQLAESWGTAVDPIRDADVVPPDLSGAGWTAVAAETALGADPRWDLR